MRIIGGNSKGKKISIPYDNKTRPLKDLVKEAIFNLLEHSNKFDTSLLNSNILDLFSGTGSFGLECYSRGAKFITFVENYSEALKVLKKNIISLNATESSQIIQKNCFEYSELNKNLVEKFDIIFLDPPFAENKFIEELKLIKKNKIYQKNHVIIIHRESKTIDNLDGIFKPLITKQYSRSKIIFGKY